MATPEYTPVDELPPRAKRGSRGWKRDFYDTVLVPNPGQWFRIEHRNHGEADQFKKRFPDVEAHTRSNGPNQKPTLYLRYNPAAPDPDQ